MNEKNFTSNLLMESECLDVQHYHLPSSLYDMTVSMEFQGQLRLMVLWHVIKGRERRLQGICAGNHRRASVQ